MLITLSINAQVQRNILGLTLGVTTKESALKILKQKNLPVKLRTGGSNQYYNDVGVSFGGVYYDGFIIIFVKNKLATILLLKEITYDNMKDYYKLVTDNLRAKYEANSKITINEGDGQGGFTVYDNKTTCNCSIIIEPLLGLRLMYSDKALMEISDKQEGNEY